MASWGRRSKLDGDHSPSHPPRLSPSGCLSAQLSIHPSGTPEGFSLEPFWLLCPVVLPKVGMESVTWINAEISCIIEYGQITYYANTDDRGVRQKTAFGSNPWKRPQAASPLGRKNKRRENQNVFESGRSPRLLPVSLEPIHTCTQGVPTPTHAQHTQGGGFRDAWERKEEEKKKG